MDRRPILGIDVDSTIWDFGAWQCEITKEITGVDVTWSEVNTWDYFHRRFGVDVTNEIFSRVLDPHRLDERPLYPNVVEAIFAIQHELGMKVIFITTNHDPDKMVGPITEWLRYHFGPDVGVAVLAPDESKLELLQALRATGMVDDRPDFIETVADAGMWAAAMRHGYNLEVLAQRREIFAFDDWYTVPEALSLALTRDQTMLQEAMRG